MYAALLEPFYRRFDRGQIKIILLEDLVEELDETTRDLFAFVGVSPSAGSLDAERNVNSARRPGEETSAQMRRSLCEVFREPNERLEKLIGRDLGRWSAPPQEDS
jgi:hypothetical protein